MARRATSFVRSTNRRICLLLREPSSSSFFFYISPNVTCVQDYTVLISCTDQLSPTGGSFELRFSRCSPLPSHSNANTLAPPPFVTSIQPHLRSNPHEEAEPYLRQILRYGPLAPSLHRLVGLLRDTLPIAVELDRLSASTREERGPFGYGRGKQKAIEEPWFDTIVKGMGWWRVLYGDLRYASLPPFFSPVVLSITHIRARSADMPSI